MKEIIVLGAGNHAKVVLDILENNNLNVLALLDDDEKIIANKIFDLQVIGRTSLLNDLSPDKYEVIISIGSPAVRNFLYQKARSLGFKLAQAVHPGASISSRAECGEGIIVNDGAVVHPDAALGENVILGLNATISHDAVIGPHTHISPGVHVTGECKIGSSVELGTGAVVLPGVSIGDNTIIGAGAVVTKDIGENVTAVGVPAEVIKVDGMQKRLNILGGRR